MKNRLIFRDKIQLAIHLPPLPAPIPLCPLTSVSIRSECLRQRYQSDGGRGTVIVSYIAIGYIWLLYLYRQPYDIQRVFRPLSGMSSLGYQSHDVTVFLRLTITLSSGQLISPFGQFSTHSLGLDTD